MKISRLHYPAGAPGFALVLMRLSLAANLAYVSVHCDSDSSAVSIAAALLACLITGGFLSRSAASFFTLAGLISTALGRTSLTYASNIVEGLALVLLGPGAWSIDALTLRRDFPTLRGRTTGGR